MLNFSILLLLIFVNSPPCSFGSEQELGDGVHLPDTPEKIFEVVEEISKLKIHFPEIHEEIEKWNLLNGGRMPQLKGLDKLFKDITGKLSSAEEDSSTGKFKLLKENQGTFAAPDLHSLIKVYEKLIPFLKEKKLDFETTLQTLHRNKRSDRHREDSSTFEIPYFIAKVAKFRGSDVATVRHLILTPVKLSSQP
ncbi:hypothetical protein AVEN_163919-1 [Araneus ventricosus]|uniref:Uncharacterized protein n=1 Tax=Araneus ventricosus TaxID=182803 RepID=A0A4Y2KA81_ARAVE|nr:hypothetical protein AVEN_163919-1 [Araneus ventricosus]